MVKRVTWVTELVSGRVKRRTRVLDFEARACSTLLGHFSLALEAPLGLGQGLVRPLPPQAGITQVDGMMDGWKWHL